MPGEPSATGEPSQRALDDPASRQHGEAFLAIIAFDDLDGEAAARAEGSGEPGTGIGLIGEQMGQPGEQPACVADEVRCPVSVLNVVAGPTAMASINPPVSTRRWRLMPLIFLAASKPTGSACAPLFPPPSPTGCR